MRIKMIDIPSTTVIAQCDIPGEIHRIAKEKPVSKLMVSSLKDVRLKIITDAYSRGDISDYEIESLWLISEYLKNAEHLIKTSEEV